MSEKIFSKPRTNGLITNIPTTKLIGTCEYCKWWWTDGWKLSRHNRCENPKMNYLVDADNVDPKDFGCIGWRKRNE